MASQKGVLFVRDELVKVAPDYQTISDCIAGERAIKGQMLNDVVSHIFDTFRDTSTARLRLGRQHYIDTSKAQRYLPQPNSDDVSEANTLRYLAYVTRAVFYNATDRTLGGYLGQLFQRPPKIELPTGLDVVASDATGERVDVTQLAKETAGYTLPYGRSGVLADYPRLGKSVTKADMARGALRPVLRTYAPWDITNWRERNIGAKRMLELVVLREAVSDVADDGFELTTRYRYRVLELTASGEYSVTLYEKFGDDAEYTRGETVIPTDSSGASFTEIPFFFVGSSNNDPKIDKPPFLDIAKLNIGHYRNSADYEESCFFCGQPTVVAAGLTQEWYDNVLGGAIAIGARAGIPLPEGGEAMFLQAAPNTLPYEAMAHKEKQLVTLGARISETPDVMRTATDAVLTAVEASAPLLSTAMNLGTAYTSALRVCAQFVGADPDAVRFELTTEATLKSMTPEEHRQMRESWLAGVLTFDEMRQNLTRAGIAGKSTDSQALSEYTERLALEQSTDKETRDGEDS